MNRAVESFLKVMWPKSVVGCSKIPSVCNVGKQDFYSCCTFTLLGIVITLACNLVNTASKGVCNHSSAEKICLRDHFLPVVFGKQDSDSQDINIELDIVIAD